MWDFLGTNLPGTTQGSAGCTILRHVVQVPREEIHAGGRGCGAERPAGIA